MKRVLSFATTLILGTAAFATTVHIDPVASAILPGETVDLNVQITDVTDLYAYQFEVAHGSVFPQSVSEGLFLSNGGATFFTSGFGGVTVSVANTLIGPVPGVSGSGTLATIRFGGIFPEKSVITPINVVLLNSALDEIPADVEAGTIAVLPEPNSGFLLGCVFGLSLLGNYWRRRH